MLVLLGALVAATLGTAAAAFYVARELGDQTAQTKATPEELHRTNALLDLVAARQRVFGNKASTRSCE